MATTPWASARLVLIALGALALVAAAPAAGLSGGPDAAGYVFRDSADANPANRPAYDFVDIQANGTQVPGLACDDCIAGPLALPFAFTHYGATYTQVYVGSNGFLTFLAGQFPGGSAGGAVPSGAQPNAVVAGYWEDLYPVNGAVYSATLGAAPNRAFVVQFQAVPHFCCFGNPATFQVKLFEGTNIIETHYKTATTDGGTHAAGIEDASGAGLRYRQGSFSLANTAVRYVPVPSTTLGLAGTFGDNNWYRTPVDVTLTCVPPAASPCARTDYRVDGLPAGFQPYLAPFQVSGDGNHQLEWFSTAASTGVEVLRSQAVKIDATPPGTSITFTCAQPGTPGWCRAVAYAYAMAASDATSGLTFVSPQCRVNGGLASCTGNLDAQGQRTFQVNATDNAGNQAGQSATFGLDSVAPAGTITTTCALPGANGWCRSASYTYAMSVLDGVSGVASFACWVDGSPAPCSGTIAGEGPHTLAINATDVAGNDGNTSLAAGIDTVAPSVASSVVCNVPGTNGWCRSFVTVQGSGTDPAPSSGLNVACRLDSGPLLACPMVVAVPGLHNATVVVTDGAGNQVNATHAFQLDGTGPAVNATVDPPPNAQGWHNTSATVTWGCSDATSGVASVSPPSVVSTQGADRPATGSCTDNAGNTASLTVLLDLDFTPPSIAFQSRTPANGAGWNNGSVTLVWACTDPLSGPATPTVSQVLAAEGADQAATGTCTDKAGNTASHTQGNVDIDLTAPSLAGSRSPGPNAFGWNNGNVTVSWACIDALSLVASVSPPATLSQEGAGQSSSGACQDNAGNRASGTVGNISIDLTAPLPSASANGTQGNAGWYRSVPQVTLACSDALSGPDSIAYALNGAPSQPYTSPFATNQEGTNTIVIGCTDEANNTGTATAQVRLDTVPPNGNATSPLVALVGYDVAWLALDATSGLAHVTVQERSVVYDVLQGGSFLGVVCDLAVSGLSLNGTCGRDPQPALWCYRLVLEDVAGNVATTSGAALLDLPGDVLAMSCTLKLAPPLPEPSEERAAVPRRDPAGKG